jgi:hypothetical protein
MSGEGFPTFGIFLLLAGLMTGMLGLIADQLSQMRLAQYETIAPHRAVQLAKDRERTIPPALS